LAGAIIVGGYSITMVQTTGIPQPGMPTTRTEENKYTFNLLSNAAASAVGGGIQVLAGPLNTQQT
jgi:hypothetical protein